MRKLMLTMGGFLVALALLVPSPVSATLERHGMAWALSSTARDVERSRIVIAEERVVATLAGLGARSGSASARLNKKTSTGEGLPIAPTGRWGRKTLGFEVSHAAEADDSGIGEPLTQNPRRDAGPVAIRG